MEDYKVVLKRTDICPCGSCNSQRVFMDVRCIGNTLSIKIYCFDCEEAYCLEKSLIGIPNDELEEHIETYKTIAINNWNKQRSRK